MNDDARLLELPVAGWLSPNLIEQLRRSEFDVDLFHSLGIAGPITPGLLELIAPRLSEVVEGIHRLGLAGPVTPELLEQIAPRVTEIVDAFHGLGLEGPIAPRELEAILRIGFDALNEVRGRFPGSLTVQDLLASAGSGGA